MVGFAALTVALTQALLIPVLATLPATLDTSVTNVEWLLTSTLLVSAVAVPVFGRLGDMFGKRRMMLVAIAALVVGSLITCFTSDITVLIVGRAIQGASMATIPLGISLLSTTLPRERVGSAIAVISAMLGVGGALALPFASVIAEHVDFHALFWVTAIGGVIAFVAVLLIVPESPIRSGGKVDLVGTALLSATLVCLLLPLAQTAMWGWGSTAGDRPAGAVRRTGRSSSAGRRPGSASRSWTWPRCAAGRSCSPTSRRSCSASPCSPR